MTALKVIAVTLFLGFGLYACQSVFSDCYSRGGRIVKNLYGIFECIETTDTDGVQWK
jgi:hypothetical protein